MDENTPMTFTSIALLFMLFIMLAIFSCRYLRPRAHNWWIRTNKEEKILLSKNKLFHANGYMIHSGSEFLLSNSGSFKRFETIDKDDYKQSTELNSVKPNSPLWNLSHTDNNIPPQPLRPAPAPRAPTSASSQSKSVTFSFSQLNEIVPEQRSITPIAEYQNLIPCIRPSSRAFELVPQRLEAPPPPRLSAAPNLIMSSTAIPRPMAKRQQALQKRELHTIQNGSTASEETSAKTLTRRNSSTNPFLCDSIDSLQESSQSTTAFDANIALHKKHIPKEFNTSNGSLNIIRKENGNNQNNPFYEDTIRLKTTDNAPKLNGDNKHNTHNGINLSLNGTNKRPMLQHQPKSFRNRSFSETDSIETDFEAIANKLTEVGQLKLNSAKNPFTGLTKRIKGPHMLQKTISEDYLFRKFTKPPTSVINGHAVNNNGNGTWTFGRALMCQDSILNMGRRNSSQISLDSMGESTDNINLERAISCDSVASETSLYFGDLDQSNYTQITGNLNIALHYDKNTITNEGLELTVTVSEAKGLIFPFTVTSFDTFVRIYLVPDLAGAMQTNIFQNSINPLYNESFTFWLKREHGRHSLWFHLYHNGAAHTLIGEAEMEIGEMPNPITTWIPLSDSRKCNAQWGELMFSLSYLPTAERLTIVVVKARNLKLNLSTEFAPSPSEVQNVFVKVYLMNNEKKVLKKRTSLKRKDLCPIFNESMIFSLPPHSLTTTQLRFTVFGVLNQTIIPLGHVITGSSATGKGLRHWHQMLSSLRKPVAMWHVLRRASNQPVFTGGAEAVVATMQSTALRAKRNSVC